jgi:hypothetical protein
MTTPLPIELLLRPVDNLYYSSDGVEFCSESVEHYFHLQVIKLR